MNNLVYLAGKLTRSLSPLATSLLALNMHMAGPLFPCWRVRNAQRDNIMSESVIVCYLTDLM
jgi:hypothetical protein